MQAHKSSTEFASDIEIRLLHTDRCVLHRNGLELDDCTEIEVDWRYMVSTYCWFFLARINCLDNLMAYLRICWNNRK